VLIFRFTRLFGQSHDGPDFDGPGFDGPDFDSPDYDGPGFDGVRNAEPEVTDRFQDGLRRQFRNSSACYKMGSYHPIAMNFGTQTKTDMLSLKFTKAEK
jgi:hypothetical protein